MRRAVRAPLVCPRCAAEHPPEERFCARCRVPLVHAAADGIDRAVSPRHARARKVAPQYAEGAAVRVAGARHQAEAELIQALLLDQGVPSTVRRAAGFDVPDFLAAGPRDVLVPLAGAVAAREILLGAGIEAAPATAARTVSPARLAIALLVALAVVALVIWVGVRL